MTAIIIVLWGLWGLLTLGMVLTLALMAYALIGMPFHDGYRHDPSGTFFSGLGAFVITAGGWAVASAILWNLP